MSPQNDGTCEIRVALVLYGGVSLAVYENGVTGCFYDLVRGGGVFAILREHLPSSPQATAPPSRTYLQKNTSKRAPNSLTGRSVWRMEP